MGQLVHFLWRVVHAELPVMTDPRELSVRELEVLERWYADKLIKNTGYRAKATKLYDGFGWSLKKYVRRYAPETNAMSISDMMRFLNGKGHTIEPGDKNFYVVGVESILLGRAYPVEYYDASAGGGG